MSTHTPTAHLLTLTRTAKRALSEAQSLSSTANAAITSTHDHIDAIRRLVPQTTFLRKAMSEQLKVLYGILDGIKAEEDTARTSFESELAALDALDADLNSILAHLKSTPIDPGFAEANLSLSRSGSADPEIRGKETLHDFVDDVAIEQLKRQLRGIIDEVQEVHDGIHVVIEAFNGEIEGFEQALHDVPPLPLLEAHPPPDETPTAEDEEDGEEREPFPADGDAVQTYLWISTHNADIIADLLLGLARHYDQCTLALNDISNGASVSTLVDPGEKEEFLGVLDRDGEQIDEVLDEVRELVGHCEDIGTTLEGYLGALTSAYDQTTALFTRLEGFGTATLPAHLGATKTFTQTRAEQTEHISTLHSSLSHLHTHYTNFSHAYTASLAEIQRRHTYNAHVLSIIESTLEELRVLGEEEEGRRSGWREEWGGWLPEGLWRGVGEGGMGVHVEVREEGGLPVLRGRVPDE
ncbi:hypothetical protein SAICODRAFT_7006 [Saitoella complicata NRRL Y-17804]|uniref:uncharacterized protein n=1 Tax=Saitoella complicata (strain BCRC 22490 / CBS 7301 / JCM 7358 / NBRC 10748 / NRRL Y-17804) TaxID=698492 RepID=UPI000866AD41|nr:uncharacterized protein SAICODRAFT_7006 [Saitoella complicata NRRL Y-17804]ODQ53761.1 hypothetical protein SAICODRAFT_7006 [Saitoella complicata NRRL Y-17804]